MADPQRPRIFRIAVERPDGTRRSRLIKAPYYEREPRDSVFGLTARLDELVLEGTLTGYTVRVPKVIGPRQREHLERWPAVLPSLLEEIA